MFNTVRAEIRQGRMVGQDRVVEASADGRLLRRLTSCSRACPASARPSVPSRRCPACSISSFDAHPVHPRPDARRHHRHADHDDQRRGAIRVSSSVPDRSSRKLLLADEINRATPKTQSALLETMQEGSVTTSGTIYHLKQPFFVMAHAEPHRAGGDVPAAGGSARSLLVQG